MDTTAAGLPAHHWWSWVLRGIAAIIFGVLALMLPGMTIAILIALFAAYAVIAGALTIVSALRHHGEVRHWWVLLLEGIVSIAAGLIAAFYPGITGLVLLYLIAFWAIVTGVLQIAAAFSWRRAVEHPFLFFLGGAASILFGILALVYPLAGALGIAMLIGIYAIVFGIVSITIGARVRSWNAWITRGRMEPV